MATSVDGWSWLYHFPNLYRAHRLYPLGCRWCTKPLTFTAWGWECLTCDRPPDGGNE